jgi:protein ImuB
MTHLAADAEADVAVLVDRLSNRLGAERVWRAAPVESDVPERSVRRVPAVAPPGGAQWPRWPRPTRLLHPPQPVEMTSGLPDQPPAAFTWRRRRHRVRRADGPERITGEWWRRDAEMAAVRDYWQVEDEAGRRFWLYRRGDAQEAETGDLRWFMHGVF